MKTVEKDGVAYIVPDETVKKWEDEGYRVIGAPKARTEKKKKEDPDGSEESEAK